MNELVDAIAAKHKAFQIIQTTFVPYEGWLVVFEIGNQTWAGFVQQTDHAGNVSLAWSHHLKSEKTA